MDNFTIIKKYYFSILKKYGRTELNLEQELNEILTKAKDLLREETTSISFDTWIKDLEIESMNSRKHSSYYSN